MARRPFPPDKSRRRPPPRDPGTGRSPRSAAIAERDLDRIAGLPAVTALFDTHRNRVHRLFFTPEMAPDAEPFLSVLAAARRPYREVGPEELERIAGTAMHGGIVALAEPRRINEARPEDLSRTGEPLLVLDGVGNPQNIGAITRTAAFFGLRRIVISDHPEQAAISDASFRIARGGLAYVDVLRAHNLPVFLAAMRTSHNVIGTALEGARPLEQITADPAFSNRPALVVLGNEEQGLPRATLKACATVVSLPGSGRVQSLNVSVTAGILIHALLRGAPIEPRPAPARGRR
ncbi:MAG: TrmH family RNA methyltransferase [Hyphomicrobiaceae bacterium]